MKNDLMLVVARCFQNFADVENNNHPPSLEALDDRAKQNYFNDALFHRKVDTVIHAVGEHYANLSEMIRRAQECAIERGQKLIEANAKIAELERKLLNETEKAKEEEVNRLGKLIHYPECWDTVNYPTLESALSEIGCSLHKEG